MSQTKARAGRSPSYPNLNLQEAIEKAETIWAREGRNAAPISAIYGHWGFRGATGPALRAVAALIKFGLLEARGRKDSREACLTDLALGIILDDREDNSERDSAIREAALVPEVHRVLWERYEGKLPSNNTLTFHLQKDMRFSPIGADALIKEFRETIAFAKLDSYANIASVEDELVPDDTKQEHDPVDLLSKSSNVVLGSNAMSNKAETTPTMIVTMPIMGGLKAAIQVPESMSEQQWDHLMSMLNGMKPGLVAATIEPNGVSASE